MAGKPAAAGQTHSAAPSSASLSPPRSALTTSTYEYLPTSPVTTAFGTKASLRTYHFWRYACLLHFSRRPRRKSLTLRTDSLRPICGYVCIARSSLATNTSPGSSPRGSPLVARRSSLVPRHEKGGASTRPQLFGNRHLPRSGTCEMTAILPSQAPQQMRVAVLQTSPKLASDWPRRGGRRPQDRQSARCMHAISVNTLIL